MPSMPGHLDVEQGDVGAVLGHGGQHLERPSRPRRPPRGRARARAGPTGRPARGPGRRRAAGGSARSSDGHPKHVAAGPSARVVTVPPTAAARSRRPTSPLPVRVPGPPGRAPGAPVPSSTTSAASGHSRTLHRVAPLCRITLVTPSRTVHANSSRRCGRHVVGGVGQLGLDLGGRQRRSAPGPAHRAGSARGSPRRPGARRPARRARAARGRRARPGPARCRRRAAGWRARP